MAKKKKSKKIIIILSSIFGIIAICLASFFIYVSIYYSPTENALAYLEDSTYSKVKEEKDYIRFETKDDSNKDNGIIFYPGGKVDYRAYAPLLRDLSDNGISSILVKMPFNLAIFNIDGAKGKEELLPEVKNWYIAGHSLGGAMASTYLGKHSNDFKGLILLGSYSTSDLSSYSNLKTLSILASNDQILNKDKYESNKKNLPSLTEKTIDGGIHSYFGDYGLQKGDGTPEISFNEQKEEMVTIISSFVSNSDMNSF